MRRFIYLLLLAIPMPAFSADLYDPNCDYRDIQGKCVSIDDGLFTIADARMNKRYGEVAAMLKKLDKTPGKDTYFKPFLQSQRSWLKYRDDYCAFDSELAVQTISDLSPMEDNKSCMAKLSDERSQQLLTIIKKYKEFADTLDEDGHIIERFE